MGILDGKKIVVAGVLTDDSLGFAAARIAQEQGAEIVLTQAPGRTFSITERTAKKLPDPVDVLEVDATNPEHFGALRADLEQRWGRVDGLVHSIAYANPDTCMGDDFLKAPWEDVAQALQVTGFSLKPFVEAVLPGMKAAGGGSVVAFDFGDDLAWPSYNWSGVAKAALRTTARYLARDLGPLGIRVNLVSAGPLKTMAARAIPGLSAIDEVWGTRAPLGWDPKDAGPVGMATAALLSDFFPATTGEVVHVDGGFHATGT